MEASEATATRFVSAIEQSFDQLRHFPLSGPSQSVLAPGLRAAFHGAYVIYYLPDEMTLTIVRVLHGARDVAALAEKGQLEPPI